MNGPQPPHMTPPPPKKNPQIWAQSVSDIVRSCLVILFWLVIAFGAATATLLAIRTLIFIYHLAIAALQGGIR